MRWIAVGLLLGVGRALAREDTLSTSAVTYCAPPENVLVQELDITYFRKNASVVFDVTASSLSADLRVALALNLTVYGNQPVSLNLNLCDLTSAICPLPLYNFSGRGTLPIPSSFSSKIPSIGYTVPDLEAFAQLELVRVDTGEVAACVSATLTNGWSMRQPGATWATVGVVLFSIVASGLWAVSQARWIGPERGLWTEKEAWRVVDIVSFIQSIAVSAMLNINYSSAYRAFSLNFPFILLLNGPIPSQTAIDRLRQRTGAKLGDDALPADEYVNRKSSPYNLYTADSSSAIGNVVQTVDLSDNLGYSISSMRPSQLARRAFINPATVTSANSLPGGIPLYVNGAGVATANAFLSVFFEWLVIGAVVLAAYLIFLLFKRLSRHEREAKPSGRGSRMMHAMVLRLGLILCLPVSIFAFHQWTLHDSWLATLLSVICLLTTWAGIVWTWIRLSFYSGDMEDGRKKKLRQELPMMGLCVLPAFIVSLFVAFAGKSGTTQVIAILVVEILSLVAAIIIRRKSRRAERDLVLNDAPSPLQAPAIPPPTRLSIILHVLRILGSGLMIAFLSSVGARPIPRAVIGIVASAVWGIGVIWAFICVVWGLIRLVRRRTNRVSDGEEREKGAMEGKEQERKLPAGPEVYEGTAPFVSPRPHPQTFRADTEQTQYYDAHTGTTPAQQGEREGYFTAR
ncbi:flavin carrier protein 2 [Ceratobasidium sp. AG-Ba]|nr:flavin carrier protein 2 [Ceratobasidium sp. AG-Ba]